MGLNYLAHDWPDDIGDPFVMKLWQMEQPRKDMIKFFLGTALGGTALTYDEILLYEDFHRFYEMGWFKESKELYDALLKSLEERGLLEPSIYNDSEEDFAE